VTGEQRRFLIVKPLKRIFASRKATRVTFAELLRPFRAKDRTDPDLERMLKAAKAGRTGVDLSKMSDKEIIQRLSRPAA